LLVFEHRINSFSRLATISKACGVEFDIRSNGKNLYIHHDAFAEGEEFLHWLKGYNNSGMIVNVKCEGMEEEIIRILAEHNIENYFLLDMSIPFLVKYARKGFRKMAVRHSEFEPMDFTMGFSGLVDWVWLDCFTGEPVDLQTLELLKSKFKVCAVSPELQGYPSDRIAHFKEVWAKSEPDAVCTKYPELWNQNK
jgi:hypothetical protein